MSRIETSEKEAGLLTAEDLDNRSLWDVERALTDVFDPDLGANIVDLGLLYKLEFGNDRAVVISLMLPSPTATYPLNTFIEEHVATVLQGICGTWRLKWIGIPSWGPDRITEKGRQQMRCFGSKP
ncbi:iron-sulfur cluster assembly protein [Arthrobacter sp. SLBN-112]|uniref:metal-sulfur cluster assembly factor n=1 Tax=Arthrobacter sp. SLBN-112 TaxID=2768452 RepID=UPI0027B1ADE8|nr:iron-sulfur cluster assembly protein [Arthrobacter sp. SLBN-112]MDQ0801437.1 metal-sulfur cluster biosynthetic enzyme [Arthrobacter sp. SLBN-112]